MGAFSVSDPFRTHVTLFGKRAQCLSVLCFLQNTCYHFHETIEHVSPGVKFLRKLPSFKIRQNKNWRERKMLSGQDKSISKGDQSGKTHLRHSASVDWARCLFKLEPSWAILHLCMRKNPPSAFQLALCFSPFSSQMEVVEFVTKCHWDRWSRPRMTFQHFKYHCVWTRFRSDFREGIGKCHTL